MDILQACDLKKTYGTGEACVHALDGVSLNVEKGEFVAIVGTSGSGKSTLLHMLGGLDRPSSGKVFVDGKDIFSLKDEERTIFRRRNIGFIFQHYNLIPMISVYENIVLPLRLDGAKTDQEFLKELTGTLGLRPKDSSNCRIAVRRSAAESSDSKSLNDKACHCPCGCKLNPMCLLYIACTQ